MRRRAAWLTLQQIHLAAALGLAAWVGCDRGSPVNSGIEASPTSAPQPVSAKTVDPQPDLPPSPIQFRDVTRQTQIDFHHTDGNSGQYYLVEFAASGLATFDYDSDGLVDVYFANGVPLRGAGPEAPPGGNRLYRNLGDWRFENVTEKAGVGPAGYGVGITAGDYNNDGHQDLYVSNFGPKVLYKNNGDGTFADVTSDAGVANGDQFGAGVCFLDIENDGDLDLYVANYVDFTYDKHVPHFTFGIPVYAGPNSFSPLRHALYRNRGDGTFEDYSEPSGIGLRPGPGMGAVCADYDNDGAQDIIVANDLSPNFCFHNDGTGKFTEVGALNGLAFNVDGMVRGSMGVDCADYDHDGRLDFFVTTFRRELPVLYHNLGNDLFRDETARSAQTQRSYNNSKWGCGFADFDNDGHKDIFVGIGHLQVNVEKFDDTGSYEATPMLLRNDGQGHFTDVTDTSGEGLKVMCVARGVALEDLDNDGRIDVVISNSRRPPVILRNQSPTTNHWLALKLRGTSVNRDAVGARVQVTAGDLVQFDEVRSGRGYQSHFGTRLHFGLGPHQRAQQIEIRWPGGRTETWTDLPADQILTLTEGTGQQAE